MELNDNGRSMRTEFPVGEASRKGTWRVKSLIVLSDSALDEGTTER